MSDGDGLTLQARTLLTVLTERGGWVDRDELAHAIQQQQLTPDDLRSLKTLALMGLIGMHQYQTNEHMPVFEYLARQP